MSSGINAESSTYCFVDLDFDGHRAKLGTAAAFVDATDSRYGFSSKDLRVLGGSEIARIADLIVNDHEWSSKNTDCGGIETRPLSCGNRVVVKLFWDAAPLACENFATLCANGGPPITNKGATSSNAKEKQKACQPAPIGSSGKPLTYRNSMIHRVIPGFIVQGGDFVFGNGSGGESIYNGKKFKDEKGGLTSKHDRRGILSMGNSGKNSNTSQFFFTFGKAPQCDGKHVVFGEIVSGWEVLANCETLGDASGESQEPKAPISIIDCGIYTPLQTPGCGYWFDQPDPDTFSGISPVFMVRPRVALVVPSEAVFQKFQKVMGSYAVLIPIIVNDTSQAAAERITTLLSNFSVDVGMVAPACKDVLKLILEIPQSWKDNKNGEVIDTSQVVIEAKPVEALSALKNNVWFTKQTSWQLELEYIQ